MYDLQGNELSITAIAQAVNEDLAVIHYWHGNGRTVAGLHIYSSEDEARAMAAADTRGQCHSMWEEGWGEMAADVGRALLAAQGKL
jgi:hypothetical protein